MDGSSTRASRRRRGGWFLGCILVATGCVRINPAYANTDASDDTGEVTTTGERGTADAGAASVSSVSDPTMSLTVDPMDSTGPVDSTGPIDSTSPIDPTRGSSTTGGELGCVDDVHEEDDDLPAASRQGPTPPGVWPGVLCPADDDWWLVRLVEPSFISAFLTALDGEVQLTLANADGVALDTSPGGGPETEVGSECLLPGDYFVVASPSSMDASIPYAFELSVEPCESCCELGKGCNDPVIAACVCAESPTCCEIGWDAACVEIGTKFCGAFCGL